MNIVFFDLNRFDYERGCEKQLVILAQNLTSQGHKVSLVGESYLYLNVRPRIENVIYSMFGVKNRHDLKNTAKVKRDFEGIEKESLNLGFYLPFSGRKRRVKHIFKRADVIYVKNEFLDSAYLYYLIGRKEFARKVIIGVHTAIFGLEGRSFHARVHNKLYFSSFYKKMLRECKYIHIPNRSCKSLLREGFQIEEDKIHYIPYVTDEERSQVEPLEAREFFTILFAGRLTEQKGVDYLKSVVDTLSKHPFFKKMKFIIAGDGEEDRIAEELAMRFDNVEFRGFVKNMDELYRNADISLILSRWETVSYIALESQARGIPVISFNIPGPRDIIADGDTGYLVELGDLRVFCDRIIQLYDKRFNSSREFVSMQECARQNIKTNFSKNKAIEEFESLFERI